MYGFMENVCIKNSPDLSVCMLDSDRTGRSRLRIWRGTDGIADTCTGILYEYYMDDAAEQINYLHFYAE